MAVETITNLTIKGYKSIRDLDNLELRAFNVLIGANGAGKSNFIDFFRMLADVFSNTSGSLQSYIARRGYASSLLFYGSQETQSISASVTITSDRLWSRYSLDISWGGPDNLNVANELLEYQVEAEDEAPKKREFDGPHPESSVLKLANSRAGNLTGVNISTVARSVRNRLRRARVYHFHDTSERSPIRVTQDLGMPANALASDGANLWVFLYLLKEHKPAHYRRILHTVQLVTPFIQDFVLEPAAHHEQSLLMGWVDRSGRQFGPHQLSDGTLRAIALATALLQPDENMPSIMLFDEPELGLHPAAIGLIADLLKGASLKTQVVVSTQSPILIREYKPEDVIVLDRMADEGGRGASRFKRLSATALGNWVERFDLGQIYEMDVAGGGPR